MRRFVSSRYNNSMRLEAHFNVRNWPLSSLVINNSLYIKIIFPHMCLIEMIICVNNSYWIREFNWKQKCDERRTNELKKISTGKKTLNKYIDHVDSLLRIYCIKYMVDIFSHTNDCAWLDVWLIWIFWLSVALKH